MAIRLEFINLIIQIKIIEKHYENGFKGLLEDVKELIGGKIWYDEYLFRDGAMNPTDIESLVNFWTSKGLTPYEEKNGQKSWKDMCVVESLFGGPTLSCDWIVFDREDNCVYLKGTEKGEIIGREELNNLNLYE